MPAGDPLLEPLLRAADESARDAAIETLIVGTARPLLDKVLSRYRGAASLLDSGDLEDVAATVSLRLVVRLRELGPAPDAAIEHFESYVATVAYNAIHDVMRRRFPNRARLKSQLRYVLTRDRRLALWTSPPGPACGLEAWRDRMPLIDFAFDRSRTSRTMLDRARAAEALCAFFAEIGDPILFESLVQTMSELWQVSEQPVAADVAEPTALAQYESRELIAALWSEIRELRPLQRTALLLNLRERDTVNIVSMFLMTGVATFEELADAIGVAPQLLASLWNELPLDDLRIAEHLGITRQQVINLRKAARERLARRILKRKA